MVYDPEFVNNVPTADPDAPEAQDSAEKVAPAAIFTSAAVPPVFPSKKQPEQPALALLARWIPPPYCPAVLFLKLQVVHMNFP